MIDQGRSVRCSITGGLARSSTTLAAGRKPSPLRALYCPCLSSTVSIEPPAVLHALHITRREAITSRQRPRKMRTKRRSYSSTKSDIVAQLSTVNMAGTVLRPRNAEGTSQVRYPRQPASKYNLGRPFESLLLASRDLVRRT